MNEYITTCEEAARAGGAVLKSKLGKVGFREKRKADLVTEADTESQDTIRKIVLGRFPGHDFLGEESIGGVKTWTGTAAKPRWIVDPLDGTTNFVHGVPFFCVSIALAVGDDILCGVLYNPMMDEFFSAVKGEGAFLNGVRMNTSEIKSTPGALVSVGFPTDTTSETPDLQAFLDVISVTQAIRRTGSAALNLGYVAAGRFDASWSFSTNPWDVAAGAIIVKEAGGVVTAPDGGPFTFADSRILAAANPALHSRLVERIGKFNTF